MWNVIVVGLVECNGGGLLPHMFFVDFRILVSIAILLGDSTGMAVPFLGPSVSLYMTDELFYREKKRFFFGGCTTTAA